METRDPSIRNRLAAGLATLPMLFMNSLAYGFQHPHTKLVPAPAPVAQAHGAHGQPFQGFGIGYHLNYGYGGKGLGVGQDGGYPFYAGPGYPQCPPPLRRFGGIVPFPFNPGPGGPTANGLHYFGGTGPLNPDRGVISIEPEPGEADPSEGYGAFTGLLPYDESAFAGATSAAARSVTPGIAPSSPVRPANPSAAAPTPPGGRLGIEYEPYQDLQDRGVRITKLIPGGAAEKVGLRVGEVLLSINGYFTHTPELVVWILNNAAKTDALVIESRPARDQPIRTLRINAP